MAVPVNKQVILGQQSVYSRKFYVFYDFILYVGRLDAYCVQNYNPDGWSQKVHLIFQVFSGIIHLSNFILLIVPQLWCFCAKLGFGKIDIA